MASKTLRGNVTIWAVRPEAFPLSQWTTALSAATWATSLASGLITDISCAVEDSYKLNLTGSSVDSTQSVCDIAKVDTPLFFEYDANFSLFRNKPGTTDMPIYDVALSLFDAVDMPYYLVKRVDKAQGSTVAAGDILSAFGVTTDYGIDNSADKTMLLYDATFKPTGGVNTNFTVLA